MRSGILPADFFKKNRSKLIERLPPRTMAVICSNYKMPRNGDQYYPYRQNSDFYYLTGIEQEESILLIIPDHPEAIFREHLLILQPTPQMEIWEGHKLSREEAGTLSGIEGISWIEEFDGIIADSIKYVENLYFNFPENQAASISIYNNSGQMVMEEKYIDNSINISELNKGVYLLMIRGKNNNYKTKFVVK